MTPTRLFLSISWLWLLLGLAASFLPQISPAWMVTGAVYLVLALVDFFNLRGKMRIELTREIPSFLALNQLHEVVLRIRNLHASGFKMEVYDGLPLQMTSDQLPWQGRIPGRGFVEITYQVKPLERGPQMLSPAHLKRTSLLGLWQRTPRCGPTTEIKVYPNFEPIIRFHLLTMTNRVDQMGIVSLNRAGVSKEFHQLRDYQEGDALTQIDWKATSRRASLISREYRQQRDQTIIIVVDCGRRMRAMDGDLSQFDHALNSVLLLSQIALRQGDSVGIMGIGSTPRWLPPVKGPHMMPVVLNHLYDYQSSGEPTDFSDAVQRLMIQQRRRAMVVFLTNLRSEDASHLVGPLMELRKKHLVVLATLQERSLQPLVSKPLQTLDDAVTCAATHLYLDERSSLMTYLRSQRLQLVDATSQDLPLALVNRYLDIKKGGQL